MKQEEKGKTEIRWFNGITESVDRSLTKFQERVKDKEDWCAAVVGSQRLEHDFTTEWQQYRHHNSSVFDKLPTLFYFLACLLSFFLSLFLVILHLVKFLC